MEPLTVINNGMSSNKQKLVIAGDSWSQGEFSRFPEYNGRVIQTHPGTHQYLIEAFPDLHLKNYGRNADNNTSQAHLLKKEWEFMVPDAVVFFWTCSLREVANKLVKREIPSDLSLGELLDHIDDSQHSAMKLLNDLGVPVLMVGGHVDLDVDKISQYDNLVPLVPRAKGLFMGGFGDIPPSTIDYNTLEGTIMNDCIDEGVTPPSLNKELLFNLSTLYKQNYCYKNFRRDEKLFPDISHGGRKIHKEISFYVIDWLRSNLNYEHTENFRL